MIEREQDPYIDWIARELRRPVFVDPSAKTRLMAQVRQEPAPRPSPLARLSRATWRPLVERRPVALSPLTTLATAAGLVAIGVLLGSSRPLRDGGRDAVGSSSKMPAVSAQLPVHDTIGVTFVLVAPQAKAVALVGDFNRWDAQATPMVRTPTGGTWRITLPLHAGRHTYAFVVDGAQWLADPAAPLAPEDGFGAANSVVLVGGSKS